MVTLSSDKMSKTDMQYADLTIATGCKDAEVQTYWYRGSWQDSLVTYWNEFSSAECMHDREYSTCGKHDTCTIAARMTLKPNETRDVKFVLSWNAPNNYNYWDEYKDENGNQKSWKNYYATIFEDSAASALYSLKNFDSLYERTLKFKDTLFSSTLDDTVLNAISANLSVLKSPTVLRLEDGSFYGWEGVYQNIGSCEGTCQHVWNYAYALCFLFPKLERSIRDIEFKYCMEESGRTTYRVPLPLGRAITNPRACLDGQMGAVIKSFREWKISGDDCWLRYHWGDIKKALEYAWSEENPDKWDLNKDGILEGRQHHTLDMELFGPSSWLEGMYLTALKAAQEMALYLNDKEKAAEYAAIFKSGYDYTKNNLFNGKYFIQKIDIHDKSIPKSFGAEQKYWNDEKNETKYQIGDGCEIDQMLGQWHADIVGLGEIFDKQQLHIALHNLYKNNFKKNIREFANPWRVFTVNDEAGTVMCDYPKDVKKPFIPLPYCEETMSGFEYSLAGLLMKNGYVEEGIELVKAVRDKYDGKKRNPWNEIECGNNYARSMASFAMLPLLAGFDYHLSKGYIGFNPIVRGENFQCLWSVGTGWGCFVRTSGKVEINVSEGYLKLSEMGLPFVNTVKKLLVNGENCDFKFDGINITIEEKDVKSLVLYFE